MNHPVGAISQHQRNYLPALRTESLPRPLVAPRAEQGAMLLSESSDDRFTDTLFEDSSESHTFFIIDPDPIRPVSAHCSVCLSEIQVAAYRRAEQLQSVDEDRASPKIDRYA